MAILEVQFVPKIIGFFHYVLSMAMPNMKFSSFLCKMAARGHFVFPIDAKNYKVLVIWDLSGYHALANMNLIGVFVTKLWPVQALACGGDEGDGGAGGSTKNIIRCIHVLSWTVVTELDIDIGK